MVPASWRCNLSRWKLSEKMHFLFYWTIGWPSLHCIALQCSDGRGGRNSQNGQNAPDMQTCKSRKKAHLAVWGNFKKFFHQQSVILPHFKILPFPSWGNSYLQVWIYTKLSLIVLSSHLTAMKWGSIEWTHSPHQPGISKVSGEIRSKQGIKIYQDKNLSGE